MRIKSELLINALCDSIRHYLPYTDIEADINEIADTTAIKALSEIQEILHSYDGNDFDTVEKIVCVFEKYNLSAGMAHDF
ncbi:MAG: hypothetical protein UH081_02040 [Clostridia bacterium]|nr:hypothetical protein [Clostridia bacterium]